MSAELSDIVLYLAVHFVFLRIILTEYVRIIKYIIYKWYILWQILPLRNRFVTMRIVVKLSHCLLPASTKIAHRSPLTFYQFASNHCALGCEIFFSRVTNFLSFRFLIPKTQLVKDTDLHRNRHMQVKLIILLKVCLWYVSNEYFYILPFKVIPSIE